MKSHYCPEEKAIIQFDGQCNWCGAKEMNKPIAIVNTNCENNIQWYDDNPKKHNGYFLYTHPVKELTDEEIKQIFVEESGFDIDTCPIAIMDFAKAILRKAQEK